MTRCKGKTAAGRVCKCKAIKDGLFCLAHLPEVVAEREKKAAVLASLPKPERPPMSLRQFQHFIYDQEWKIFSGQQSGYDYSLLDGRQVLQ
jgi:hypothetical protein